MELKSKLKDMKRKSNIKTEKNEEENKQYYTKEIWNAFTEVPAGKKISEITEDLYECNWLSVHEDPSCIIEEKNRILPQTIELESTNYVFREITPGDKKEIKFFIESPAGNLTNKKVFILGLARSGYQAAKLLIKRKV